jgi:hypothetical protein
MSVVYAPSPGLETTQPALAAIQRSSQWML